MAPYLVALTLACWVISSVAMDVDTTPREYYCIRDGPSERVELENQFSDFHDALGRYCKEILDLPPYAITGHWTDASGERANSIIPWVTARKHRNNGEVTFVLDTHGMGSDVVSGLRAAAPQIFQHPTRWLILACSQERPHYVNAEFCHNGKADPLWTVRQGSVKRVSIEELGLLPPPERLDQFVRELLPSQFDQFVRGLLPSQSLQLACPGVDRPSSQLRGSSSASDASSVKIPAVPYIFVPPGVGLDDTRIFELAIKSDGRTTALTPDHESGALVNLADTMRHYHGIVRNRPDRVATAELSRQLALEAETLSKSDLMRSTPRNRFAVVGKQITMPNIDGFLVVPDENMDLVVPTPVLAKAALQVVKLVFAKEAEAEGDDGNTRAIKRNKIETARGIEKAANAWIRGMAPSFQDGPSRDETTKAASEVLTWFHGLQQGTVQDRQLVQGLQPRPLARRKCVEQMWIAQMAFNNRPAEELAGPMTFTGDSEEEHQAYTVGQVRQFFREKVNPVRILECVKGLKLGAQLDPLLLAELEQAKRETLDYELLLEMQKSQPSWFERVLDGSPAVSGLPLDWRCPVASSMDRNDLLAMMVMSAPGLPTDADLEQGPADQNKQAAGTAHDYEPARQFGFGQYLRASRSFWDNQAPLMIDSFDKIFQGSPALEIFLNPNEFRDPPYPGLAFDEADFIVAHVARSVIFGRNDCCNVERERLKLARKEVGKDKHAVATATKQGRDIANQIKSKLADWAEKFKVHGLVHPRSGVLPRFFADASLILSDQPIAPHAWEYGASDAINDLNVLMSSSEYHHVFPTREFADGVCRAFEARWETATELKTSTKVALKDLVETHPELTDAATTLWALISIRTTMFGESDAAAQMLTRCGKPGNLLKKVLSKKHIVPGQKRMLKALKQKVGEWIKTYGFVVRRAEAVLDQWVSTPSAPGQPVALARVPSSSEVDNTESDGGLLSDAHVEGTEVGEEHHHHHPQPEPTGPKPEAFIRAERSWVNAMARCSHRSGGDSGAPLIERFAWAMNEYMSPKKGGPLFPDMGALNYNAKFSKPDQKPSRKQNKSKTAVRVGPW